MDGNSDKQAYEERHAEKKITPIHTGRLISVHAESFTTSLGHVHTDIVSHPGAVAILPIDAEGRLLLIRQWRRAVEQVLIEVPAGTLEPGEAPDVCAQRELQEEVGFKASHLIPLGLMYTCPGFCTEKIYLYLAEGLSYSPLPGDEHEVIDQLPVTLDQALKMVDEGVITDSKTITALFHYIRYKEKTKR